MTTTQDGLNLRDLLILEVEGRFYRHAGSKDAAIREELGLTPTAYYVALGRLIDRPAALAHDPVLVGRLRRMRQQRRPWARTG